MFVFKFIKLKSCSCQFDKWFDFMRCIVCVTLILWRYRSIKSNQAKVHYLCQECNFQSMRQFNRSFMENMRMKVGILPTQCKCIMDSISNAYWVHVMNMNCPNRMANICLYKHPRKRSTWKLRNKLVLLTFFQINQK